MVTGAIIDVKGKPAKTKSAASLFIQPSAIAMRGTLSANSAPTGRPNRRRHRPAGGNHLPVGPLPDISD